MKAERGKVEAGSEIIDFVDKYIYKPYTVFQLRGRKTRKKNDLINGVK